MMRNQLPNAALHRVLAPALTTLTVLTALTGCGLIGPATYDTDETAIEADSGEEFTLSVPSNASLGERWYVATPKPAAGVLRATGEDQENSGSEADGAGGGSQLFHFKAVGQGSTRIRLIHCPVHACIDKGDSATASPPPPPGSTAAPASSRPTYRTYTVTVK
ncbi:protease inhibitor I42 family protein [Streptomyces inhibens]|uniref:protease inhibitor I42 family protein n=1 Tax=Streptomyces inhibens TaxID=2293571 RepID=UPI001EE6E338|nr:protease inhibitor I42 family protein [Streptomyces inhibens]UKY54693.1 protease inhibitor I42 family protein [Streptomyces inhibens]